MSLVVDASVAAKWFLSEADSALATALLGGGQQIVAPALLRIELAAAISRQHRLGVIDADAAQVRFQSMQEYINEPTVRLLDNEALLSRAMAIAVELKHPLQDCLYIACAEHLRAELVTADPKLLQRATGEFSFVRAL